MKERSGLRRAIRMAVVGIGAIALLQELRKPKADREWNGRVGFVPYDFRLPTPSRVRERYWNPDDERIFVPQLFGVGWTVNLGRVVKLIRS